MTYIEREALVKEFDKISDHDVDVDEAIELIAGFPAADVAPVKRGAWELRANKENVNCRWNVEAHCDNCHFSKGEVWAGFFPGIPDAIALNVALDSAENCELPNYCENCGCKMDREG